jgi:hypothetical protein
VRLAAFLADFASVADNKLMVIGGGVNVIRGPFALAGFIYAAWDETNKPFNLAIRLTDADGQPAPLSAPLEVRSKFRVGRPAEATPGMELPLPIALMFGMLPLLPKRYEFRFEIDNESRPEWSVAFEFATMPGAPPQ